MARSKSTVNFSLFGRLPHYKKPPIVKLFCPYKNMYIRLKKIAEKAMGEIAYNKLVKIPICLPWSLRLIPFSATSLIFGLDFFYKYPMFLKT